MDVCELYEVCVKQLVFTSFHLVKIKGKNPPIFLHSLSLHSRVDAGFEPVLQVLPAFPVKVCLQITDRLCIPNPHPAEHCQGEKHKNIFFYMIQYPYIGGDYLTVIEMKVQVKQI